MVADFLRTTTLWNGRPDVAQTHEENAFTWLQWMDRGAPQMLEVVKGLSQDQPEFLERVGFMPEMWDFLGITRSS